MGNDKIAAEESDPSEYNEVTLPFFVYGSNAWSSDTPSKFLCVLF